MPSYDNKDYYPTPGPVIDAMLAPFDLSGKVVLEPSAGSGNLVESCLQYGASEVLACETDKTLRAILATKQCRLIGSDFLQVKSEDISHIDYIVMNPPFIADEKHITYAFEIAPPGCQIISLCNWQTIRNEYSLGRRQLGALIANHGQVQKLGDVFQDSERPTNVEIGLVTIRKPSTCENGEVEFEGFFIGPDSIEAEGEGIIPYNFVRDIVNRYVEACKIYDKQIESAVAINRVLDGFYKSEVAFVCTENGQSKARNVFQKDLQKSAWRFVFDKMGMEKLATTELLKDINKFVEQQSKIPFTMRNIYRMLEIIIATQDQRLDRTVEEVFDSFTKHYHENRHGVEGWKTNEQYLFGKKFIVPYMAEPDWSGGTVSMHTYGSNWDKVTDLIKVLSTLSGKNYDTVKDPACGLCRVEPGQWHDWGFFEFKLFKKGTGHFKFKDMGDWARLNQRVAKIKGYVLPEKLK
jgi:hypothetical protein